MSNTDVLTVKQAAELLGISRRAVIHRITAGTLAATKLGPSTTAYIIDRAEIERAKGDATA